MIVYPGVGYLNVTLSCNQKLLQIHILAFEGLARQDLLVIETFFQGLFL